MEKQFVTYEIALKLKELDFDKECLAWFAENKKIQIASDVYKKWTSKPLTNLNIIKVFNIDCITAPLYQQVTDWFREKHNIHIEIELTDNTMQFYYQYCIVDSKNRECHDEDMIDQATRIYNYNERFNTYEEAREQAILKTIELCQKEK